MVDPRRTRTAEEADEHHFIRPGADALLLAAMACTIVEEELEQTWRARPAYERARGRAALRPRVHARGCGRRVRHRGGEIRRMARELASATRAAVYARIGTCTQEFGTLASWLVDVLNVLTGNLDREGGAMFTKRRPARRTHPAPEATGAGSARPLGQPRARTARDLGELPVAALAEEIETPGEGRCARSSRWPATRCVSTPNANGSPGPWRSSTSWSRSTSTSTRPRATPT